MRREELEILIQLSKAIASIQDREELFKVILGKIRPIFRFHTMGLLVYNKEADQYLDWARERTNPKGDSKKLFEYDQDHPISSKNRYLQWIKREVDAFEEPLLVDLEDLYSRFSDKKDWEHYQGFKSRYCLVSNLEVKSRHIGLFCLDSAGKKHFDPGHLALFQAIADQLAVAVSNILANEDIHKRQREKEALLSISDKIALTRNPVDLARFLTHDLKPLFGFDDAVVLVINTDEDHYYPLAFEAPFEIRTHEHFKNIVAEKKKYKGSPQEKIFHSFRPSEFVLGELRQSYPEFEPLVMLDEAGIKKTLGVSLKQGGKTIGSLLFHYKTGDEWLIPYYDLFTNVAGQISIAVANILANEKIQQREREEALKASLVNALNEGENWEEKLLGVTRALEEDIPFNIVSFGMMTGTPGTPDLGFERIGPDEYRTLNIASFLQMAQAGRSATRAMSKKYPPGQGRFLNGRDFTEASKSDPVKRSMADVFGTKSLMAIAVPIDKERCIYVSFYSQFEDVYRQEHLAMFERMKPSFMLAMEKQLNYQEVLRLNELILQENVYLEKELQLNYNFEEIIGSSEAMQQVFEQVQQVAGINSSVLITGETGTGKELIARALHNYSQRKRRNFVKLNCATLPAQLLESELFGHERGSFTGAHERRIGKFELADKGTIFLDEIGEMPLELQVKLLRVLQEREFERLGGNEVIRTDLRVIAATNRNLQLELRRGRFRSDLFYRLNVFPIHLPALRDRKEDIAELAEYFIEKHNKRIGKKVKRLSDTALEELMSYDWPGNIRELEHIIERSVIIAKTDTLDVVLEKVPMIVDNGSSEKVRPLKTYRKAEIDLILDTLQHTKGKISGVGGAAEILDIPPATLESKMRKFGIKRRYFLEDRNGL